jgi:L,D-transpeptidase ErfK/SrfK
VPALARAQQLPDTVEFNPALSSTVRRNASSFRALDWQPYFSDLRNGVILVDINSRALHYWSRGRRTYRLYPTSVPLSEDLTRRGRTSVTYKDPNPDWRPTPAMRSATRNGRTTCRRGRTTRWARGRCTCPGPTIAIHGTHDTRKIGRRSSNGCIGLYNENIEELFEWPRVGTQVLLI